MNPSQWNNTPPHNPNQWNTGPSQPQPTTPTPTPQPTKHRSKLIPITAFIVALAVFTAAGLWIVNNTTLGQKIASMTYLSAADPGPEAFMSSTANTDAEEIVAQSPPSSPGLTGGVEGTSANLYGGTGQLSACDAAALIQNLSKDGQLNSAFAQGIGINADDVENFINTLNPLVLMQDTWVTNHGYNDGKATPFQSVLQKGTAVMVDVHGVPRVRCACGNPLAEAWNGYTAPNNAETAWDGYDPKDVIAVYGAEAAASSLDIKDLQNDQSESLEIPENARTDLQNIQENVTPDTPTTVPSDMDVTPDTQLLDSLGMTPAENGDARPTGADRFTTTNGTFGTTAAPNTDTATPVDPSTFEISQGVYYVRLDGDRGWCFAKTTAAGSSEPSFVCSPTALDTDLKKVVSEGSPPLAGKLDRIIYETSQNRFETVATPDLGGPEVTESAKNLKKGESVTIDQFTCKNLSDHFSCEGPGSKFKAVDHKGIFVDNSDLEIGGRCGEIDYIDTARRASVRLIDGSTNCAEADRVASAFLTPGAQREIDGWTCKLHGPDDSEALEYRTNCKKQSTPFASIVI